MRSKKIAYLFLALGILVGFLGGSIFIFFLTRPHPPPPPEDIVAHLTSDLGLSEEQVQKITPIVEQMVRELEKLHEETLDRMVEIIHRHHKAMEPFLTSDQIEKFRRITKEREKAFRREAQSRRPSPKSNQ